MEHSPAQPEFFASAVNAARRFYLDLASDPDAPLSVVCGGYEECRPDYEINRDDFDYYSVELVTKGRGVVTLCGVEHELEPGSLFTYGPGTPHRIRPRRTSRLVKLFVDFVGRDAVPLLDRLGCPPGGVGRVGAIAEVRVLWNELIRDGLRRDGSSPELCAALLRCLVLRVAAHRVSDAAAGLESYKTYQRCVAHITANAGDIVTQRQAADECGVTPAYLSRLFKRHGRQSPYSLLTRLRMNLAAERLLDPTVTVRRVAEDLGYSDQFHFSRAFKATMGVSPTEFRRLR